MPRLRPQKVFEVGPFDEPTVWQGPRIAAGQPERAARIRVVRPAGGGNKASVVFDGRVVSGRRVVRPDAVRVDLPAAHRLYVTVDPPLRGVTVELTQVEVKDFSEAALATALKNGFAVIRDRGGSADRMSIAAL